MGQYADLISTLKLYKALEASAGRDDISSSDVDALKGTVCQVADAIGAVLATIPRTFAQYTEHDITHCANVIRHMGNIIPEHTLKVANALEIAELLLAGLLHDVGMVVTEDEKIACLAGDDFERFRAHHRDRQ